MMPPIVRSSSLLAWQLMVWVIVVGLPLTTAALAWVWLEVCKVLFIAGAFLAILAYLAQLVLSWYAAPIRHLSPGICFAQERVIAAALPCSATAWLAVALFYSLVSTALAALARQAWQRWGSPR